MKLKDKNVQVSAYVFLLQQKNKQCIDNGKNL